MNNIALLPDEILLNINTYLNDRDKNKLYLNSPNYQKISSFISTIDNTNSQTIYKTINDIDYKILYDLFRILDLNQLLIVSRFDIVSSCLLKNSSCL
jgi:hypothetical protein